MAEEKSSLNVSGQEQIKDMTPPPPVEPTKKVAPAPGPGKLRSIAKLLKDSWGIFTGLWAKYLLFVLIIIAIALGLGVIAALILIGGVILVKTSWIIALVLILIGGLLAIYLGLALGLGVNRFIYTHIEGSPEGYGQSLSYGFKNSLAFFLVSVLSAIIIISAPAVAAVISGVMFSFTGVNVGTIVIAAILVVPSVILAVYLGVMLSYVSQNFIIEGNRGITAIKRSWELVKGSFWSVLIRILLLGLISLAIQMLNQGFDNTIYIILAVMAYMLQFIYSLFAVAYNYFIYKDLAK